MNDILFDLLELSVEGVTFISEVDKARYYVAEVEADIENVTFRAKKDNGELTYLGDLGTHELKKGVNTFKVDIVKDEDCIHVLHINIVQNQKKEDDVIKQVLIDGEPCSFQPELNCYWEQVPGSKETINIEVVTANGNDEIAGDIGEIYLDEGENPLLISVSFEKSGKRKLIDVMVLRSDERQASAVFDPYADDDDEEDEDYAGYEEKIESASSLMGFEQYEEDEDDFDTFDSFNTLDSLSSLDMFGNNNIKEEIEEVKEEVEEEYTPLLTQFQEIIPTEEPMFSEPTFGEQASGLTQEQSIEEEIRKKIEQEEAQRLAAKREEEERLAQEKLIKERMELEKRKQEEERLANERLIQERIEQEERRKLQERIEQEERQKLQEKLAQEEAQKLAASAEEEAKRKVEEEIRRKIEQEERQKLEEKIRQKIELERRLELEAQQESKAAVEEVIPQIIPEVKIEKTEPEVVVEEEDEDEAKLQSLSVEGATLKPAFSPDIYEYTLILDGFDVDEIEIFPEAMGQYTQVKYKEGRIPLKKGNQKFDIITKSSNKKSKYTLTLKLSKAKKKDKKKKKKERGIFNQKAELTLKMQDVMNKGKKDMNNSTIDYKLLIICSALLISLVVIYTEYLEPSIIKEQDRLSEREQIEKQADVVAEKVANEEQFIAEIELFKEASNIIKDRYPQTAAQQEILNFLHNIKTKTGVKVLSTNIGMPSVIDAKYVQQKTIEKNIQSLIDFSPYIVDPDTTPDGQVPNTHLFKVTSQNVALEGTREQVLNAYLLLFTDNRSIYIDNISWSDDLINEVVKVTVDGQTVSTDTTVSKSSITFTAEYYQYIGG